MMSRSEENKLPPSWAIARIADVTIPVEKINPESEPDKPFIYIDISSINNQTNRIDQVKTYQGSDAPSRARQLVKYGDTLFSTVRTYLKNIALVPEKFDNQIASTGFSVLRASNFINNAYLFFYTLSITFLQELETFQRGVSYPAVRDSDIRNQPIPIAPLNEQNRIVEKVEELFSEIDKGIEYLRTAQEQLTVYRQSVLKNAFEGKLTEQWREAHIDQMETADQLLGRIQKERENCYQQQLNKWGEAVKTWEEHGREGKKPTKPKMPSEITSLTEEELEKLPPLPEGWCWTRVQALGEVQLGRQRSPQNRSRDYPTKYIRAANITEDGFDLTDVMDMDFNPHEFERYQLKYGDILLSEASGSPDQAGKPALWRDQIPNCCFQNTVIRFQPICLSSEYMLNIFRHFYFNKIFSKVASGVGINHLSASKFSALPVPLAPLEEQQNITQLIELKLSIHNQLETVIDETLQKSKILQNSILKRAFSGHLVPQDSSDEHAAVLLERIREARKLQEGNKVYMPNMPKLRKQVAMKNDLSIRQFKFEVQQCLIYLHRILQMAFCSQAISLAYY